MQIVPLYASLLALLFVALSIRTLRMRHKLKVSLGDAGNEALLRAVRVHSNFAEYVPIALLVLILVETSGASPVITNALAICLVAGRISHAYGVSQTKENFRFRVAGMAMTFTSIIGASLALLASYAR